MNWLPSYSCYCFSNVPSVAQKMKSPQIPALDQDSKGPLHICRGVCLVPEKRVRWNHSPKAHANKAVVQKESLQNSYLPPRLPTALLNPKHTHKHHLLCKHRYTPKTKKKVWMHLSNFRLNNINKQFTFRRKSLCLWKYSLTGTVKPLRTVWYAYMPPTWASQPLSSRLLLQLYKG